MSGRVAIVAALPREIAGLVRGVRAEPRLRQSGIHLYLLADAVVVAAGMGGDRATVAFNAALSVSAISSVISTGLAGGCFAGAIAGEVFEAGVVLDARSGERYETGYGEATLVTTGAIAGIQEKQRLHATYQAAMVDMEAAMVARLAAAHDLPFRAIKAISDAHDFELTSLAKFSGRHGSFRTRAFALHTALRPRTWAHAARLGRDSNRALSALQKALKRVVDGD